MKNKSKERTRTGLAAVRVERRTHHVAFEAHAGRGGRRSHARQVELRHLVAEVSRALVGDEEAADAEHAARALRPSRPASRRLRLPELAAFLEKLRVRRFVSGSGLRDVLRSRPRAHTQEERGEQENVHPELLCDGHRGRGLESEWISSKSCHTNTCFDIDKSDYENEYQNVCVFYSTLLVLYTVQ